MFLQQLPDAVRWLTLFVGGAALGAGINLAIYRLAIFRNRHVSPWSPAPSSSRPRTPGDRIPILGWLRLRRESDVFGKGHWIRPLLIELAMGFGMIGFYGWMMSGGLYGGTETRLAVEQRELVGNWNFAWFCFHAVLIALMTVATFIDFDEQTIPDWVTIPGTLLALVSHVFWPTLRLPYTQAEVLSQRLQPLDFWSPQTPTAWHLGSLGLAAALAIAVIWCLALLPMRTSTRWGWRRGLRILWLSILRPARQTSSKLPRLQPRRMYTQTKFLFGLAIVMVLFVTSVFIKGGDPWTALMDSLLGLAMGGGIVWAVRIIAGRALGVEAMGFGDVTLMAMIGAFLGWQAALLAFVIAPFTSLVVALAQVILSGENRLAFGPYLCLGTLIVMLGWNHVWNHWASEGVFALGGTFLLVVVVVCLVMMAIMLGVWGRFKDRPS